MNEIRIVRPANSVNVVFQLNSTNNRSKTITSKFDLPAAKHHHFNNYSNFLAHSGLESLSIIGYIVGTRPSFRIVKCGLFLLISGEAPSFLLLAKHQRAQLVH